MKTITTVGIVGAGTMGAALAQKFAQEGFTVLLADREMRFVNKGMDAIRAMLREGVERRVFTEPETEGVLSRLRGTANLNDLAGCDLVIEAIYEDFEAKCTLFRNLSDLLPATTLLATNTSSFSVTELARAVKDPGRFLGLHYFYHAAKNRLVEIVPGDKTTPETLQAAYRFSVLSGKDPIYTRDTYGFAVNRFFVPWLNAAVRLLEEGIANIDEIDAASRKALGIGMGPFALMNATGIPVAMHAERTLEVFGPSYAVADRLVEQVAKKENWPLADPEQVSLDPARETAINERLLGCIFFVCAQILEEDVCSATDLNKGARIGLRWRKGPVDLMQQLGESEVTRLVQQYANRHGEPMPVVAADTWRLEHVSLARQGNRAIITMNRPEDLNALDESVVRQLDIAFCAAENDPAVQTIFITGTGKAFVAGADIRFFIKNIKNKSLDKIVDFTRYGQEVFNRIDRSPKKVVALLNGLTLGGGLELALCADRILAVPKAAMAFPETGIGIYPGLGGTHRCSRRVGKGLAKYLILTGKIMTASDAAETGLIDAVIAPETIFDLLDGRQPLPEPVPARPGDRWKALAELYSRNPYRAIIEGRYTNGFIDKDLVQRLARTMEAKAPVAMQIAEELIEQGNGPQAELEKLTTIFSTSDALLGLSNIGKKVIYSGS